MILKVAIFDYGVGNIFSLKNALEQNDAQVDVITSLNKSKEYSGLLLPGVGNFDPCNQRGFVIILQLISKIMLLKIYPYLEYVLEWKCSLKEVKKVKKKV